MDFVIKAFELKKRMVSNIHYFFCLYNDSKISHCAYLLYCWLPRFQLFSRVFSYCCCYPIVLAAGLVRVFLSSCRRYSPCLFFLLLPDSSCYHWPSLLFLLPIASSCYCPVTMCFLLVAAGAAGRRFFLLSEQRLFVLPVKDTPHPVADGFFLILLVATKSLLV